MCIVNIVSSDEGDVIKLILVIELFSAENNLSCMTGLVIFAICGIVTLCR